MFHIALFEPCIAPNTGNIIRLTANNGCQLHLIEPLGFSLDEKSLRRAGLDYHDLTSVKTYRNFSHFLEFAGNKRMFAITTKGSNAPGEVQFQQDDVLLFGSETAGLPQSVMDSFTAEYKVKIPMIKNNRSLNLANAVAIVSYEAWRQLNYAGSGG